MYPQARTPIGSFISIWYGEDGDDVAAEKHKRDVEARTPVPIGSFISIWYGEDGDDAPAAGAEKRKRGVETRTPIPIGSFISIWYGEDGDEASNKKRAVELKKREPDVVVR